MNYTGNEAAGQYGLGPDQLTKMGIGKQRNCAALYLLREIEVVSWARYVKRHLGALHSGHSQVVLKLSAVYAGSVGGIAFRADKGSYRRISFAKAINA